jgi:hypothetical protein
MYTERGKQWRKVEKFTEEKSGGTTRRLQSVCDTSDICDKCDVDTTTTRADT